ncbi:MAG: DUF4476 domain-containing protein, partial [Flavobacteriales bacterium]
KTTIMKKMYALLIPVLLTTGLFAQGKLNIVIFSEDGEPFFAYVNGIRQNPNAETNIRVTDLTTESFHFRIVFANSTSEPITKDQYLPFGSEYTFKIKKAKKGFKLAPFGQVALGESTSTAPSYGYTTTENTGTTANTANTINSNANNTANTNVAVNGTTNGTTGTNIQTSETITTTTTTNQGTTNGTENVGLNMNVGANGMSINMNVNGTETGNTSSNVNTAGNTNVTTTTTSTTTYSTTSTGITGNTQQNNTTGYTENTNTNYNNNTTTNNTASTACYYPASDADFTKMKTSVESKTYQDVMMSTAKQATKNNCLNTTQIGEIMKLFMMDEDKLAYAKYAYDYCTEKQNYYQLADVLTYSATQEEFNSWLEKK